MVIITYLGSTCANISIYKPQWPLVSLSCAQLRLKALVKHILLLSQELSSILSLEDQIQFTMRHNTPGRLKNDHWQSMEVLIRSRDHKSPKICYHPHCDHV